MFDWLSRDGLASHAMARLEDFDPVCIVTLVASKGSVPQDLGAKILLSREGENLGTVGGGKVEAAAIALARELLKNSEKSVVFLKSWNLQKDLGMSCGGEVTFLFELVRPTPPWTIAIFGAGHVAQALVPLLLKLHVQIVWFDDRAEWLERGPVSSPRLKKMHVVAPEELHREIERLAEESFILSLTKGHASDLQVLRSVIKRKFPYIGVIGSKTKGLSLRRQLIEEGFDAASAERFFCPVGEPFGSNQPEEIAFSIIAQVLKVRDHFRHPPLDPQ